MNMLLTIGRNIALPLRINIIGKFLIVTSSQYMDSNNNSKPNVNSS